MQYKFMEIKPVSTVFFNSGVNTDMGTSNWVKSKTMPYLSVFYGAVATGLMRNGYLKSVLEKIQQENKEVEIYREIDRKLSIKGSYLTDGSRFYLPAPLDLFLDTDQRVYQGSYRGGMLWLPDSEKNFIDKLKTVEGYYISLNDFCHAYQENKMRNIHLKGQTHFWTFYHKTGIKENPESKSAEESYLYMNEQAVFRDNDYAYVIQAACEEEKSLEKEYLLTLGGACKTAFMKKTENDSLAQSMEEYGQIKNQSEIIKLIFTAPFFYDAEAKMFPKDVEILCRVTGKPEYIGGYNMAEKRERPVQEAYPAGAILLLRSKAFINKSFREIHKKLEENLPLELYRRGAGSFLLSKTEEETE